MDRQTKIECAKRLNNEYYQGVPARDRWEEIKTECRKSGIKEDLVLISPDVFKMLVTTKSIDKYLFDDGTDGENK